MINPMPDFWFDAAPEGGQQRKQHVERAGLIGGDLLRRRPVVHTPGARGIRSLAIASLAAVPVDAHRGVLILRDQTDRALGDRQQAA